MMNTGCEPNPIEDLADLRLEELLQRLNKNPADGEILLQIGKRYYESGNFHLAEIYYQQALEVNADDFWAHIFLGYLHYRCRQYREAIIIYSHARKLRPNLSCPYWCLADVYAAMGKTDLAESNYKMAVKVQPGDRQAKRFLDEWYEFRYAPK